MPELPEVETTLQGLKPHLEGAIIRSLVLRHTQLRWPISPYLETHLVQQTFGTLSRRAKYLLMPVNQGTLIIHLGMSGCLQIVTRETLPKRHDHMDIVFSDTHLLRYTDPRRFGAILWTDDEPCLHSLIKSLGPEPLGPDFTVAYLKKVSANRRIAIKSLIMDSHVVVGVGNIYAAEALFLAKIHPLTTAALLSDLQCQRLLEAIQFVLRRAIKQGGTTLKDFVNSEGKPGYFAQELQVYGRGGEACRICTTPLVSIKLDQRSTVFCKYCQVLSTA